MRQHGGGAYGGGGRGADAGVHRRRDGDDGGERTAEIMKMGVVYPAGILALRTEGSIHSKRRRRESLQLFRAVPGCPVQLGWDNTRGRPIWGLFWVP